MYEAPKLVRFGKFRDLTLQGQGACEGSAKTQLGFDLLFMGGTVQTGDGCPAPVVRS